MPLALCDAVPGAYVEEYFDKAGKPLPVRRRGWITKVVYPDDSAFDNSRIDKCMVLFDAEKGAEDVKLSTINLVRRADEAALARIKQAEQDEKAGEILATLDQDGEENPKNVLGSVHHSPVKRGKGVVTDRSGVEPPKNGKGLSPKDAENL